jgi:hypothetical protein
MRLSYLLIVLFLSICLLLGLSITEAAKKKGKGSDAARYHDCHSCVEAGFGWSWEEEECGTYLNTDCSTPAAPDTETERSSSNYDSGITTDRDDDGDDEDYVVDDTEIDADDVYTGPKTFDWADTDATTHIWRIVHAGDYASLSQLLDRDSDVVKYRSADGRGALWWAYEYGQEAMVDLLIANGADEEAADAHGNKPSSMKQQRDL